MSYLANFLLVFVLQSGIGVTLKYVTNHKKAGLDSMRLHHLVFSEFICCCMQYIQYTSRNVLKVCVLCTALDCDYNEAKFCDFFHISKMDTKNGLQNFPQKFQ